MWLFITRESSEGKIKTIVYFCSKYYFMSPIKAWITAFRLRTLPLAFSSIFMGSFVAYYYGTFEWSVFGLAIATTLFLQILSNLANDYGDTVNGADHEGRLGPQRMVQSGAISLGQMKVAIVTFTLLSFVSGLFLIYVSFGNLLNIKFLIFLILGLAAIGAAMKYTMGKNPYGYKGLGDIYVLVFFGLIGVGGTYFLHAVNWNWLVLLPALSVGFLSAGVLNVNNMRDVISDKEAGKHTLVVKMGLDVAKKYHYSLVIMAIVFILAFVFVNDWVWSNFTFVLAVPLLLKHIVDIKKAKSADEFDPQLKKLALSTLVFVLLFGVGLLLK